MAFSVGQRVQVADQSVGQELCWQPGTVISVTGDIHQVRPDGFGCRQTVPLRTNQLRADLRTPQISYSLCAE